MAIDPSAPLIELPAPGTPLDLQVALQLAADTDPTQGLVPALGQRPDDSGARSGVNSIYPNYSTDGPDKDRGLCPTPFIVVEPGAVRALDKNLREVHVIVEVHEDPDMGRIRWPGILKRVKQVLVRGGWAPASDADYSYHAGLYFDEESPPGLFDTRYETSVVQCVFAVRAQDTTSGAGVNR